MAEEPVTLSTLARFHREVILPDLERVVGEKVDASERRLRDEMQTGFDALATRLDRLGDRIRDGQGWPQARRGSLERS